MMKIPERLCGIISLFRRLREAGRQEKRKTRDSTEGAVFRHPDGDAAMTVSRNEPVPESAVESAPSIHERDENLHTEVTEDQHSNSADAKCLSALLEDDYYLTTVLEKLLEDGLQECRLVCKRWRDVCSSLPVKLAVLDRKDLQKLPAMFPNVPAVSVLSYPRWSRHQFKRPSGLKRDRSLDGWFAALIELTNLRSLSIETMHATECLFHEEEPLFLPLVHLQSLAIKSTHDHYADEFFRAIRVLTNLTSLKLIAERSYPQPMRAEPVTEIQQLRELDISVQLFANDAGHLMFPRVGHLTHLGFWDPSLRRTQSSAVRPSLLAKVVECCETSLRSLRLYHCTEHYADPDDWSVLLQFPHLETLVFDCVRYSTGDLERVVGDLFSLTSLSLNGVRYSHEVTSIMLSSLSGLKSLCYLPSSGSTPSCLNAPGLEIRHLTQLTALTTVLYSLSIPFHDLTGLVELDVQLALELDLSDTVSRLTLLESLKLLDRRHACLKRPSVLRHLTRLKALTLEMPNDVAGDFFPALGSLPGLTFLQFNCHDDKRSIPFLSRISLVENLSELSIERLQTVHPLRFLHQASLPKLRSLRLQPFPDLEETKEELRQRLPYLRKITP